MTGNNIRICVETGSPGHDHLINLRVPECRLNESINSGQPNQGDWMRE